MVGILDSLTELLKKHKVNAPVTWNTARPTRHESQWFIGKHWKIGEKDFYAATFGDFKQNLKLSWRSDGEYSPEELAQVEDKIKEITAAETEEKERVQLEVSAALEKEWETYGTEGTSPYLYRKQIDAHLFGARIKANPQGDPIIVVPLRDVDGKLWNVQRIYSKKMSKGDKFFESGARIEGCFHLLETVSSPRPSRIEDEKVHYLCEGFATACSVQLSLGDAARVVSTFNAQNLEVVAKVLRERYPKLSIVVCADNDAYTVINGKPVNVGLIKGRRAAGITQGELRYPKFKYPKQGLTDFNDLHCAEGLEAVKFQLENASTELEPIIPEVTKNGRLIPITLVQIRDHLLKYYNGNLIKREGSLYKYNGKYWELVETDSEDEIKQQINFITSNTLKMHEINAAFQFLVIYVPSPRGVRFQSNPYIANFQNGSLHFKRLGDKKYVTEFRPHQREDWQINCLPFDYLAPDAELPPAPRFDMMMENLFSRDSDKDAKKQVCLQLMGAALMPAFPIVALFVGPPGSGKSTMILTIKNMVSSELASNVQMHEMHGFNLESMAGKVFNYDTDMDTKRPINDSAVKKLIDISEVTIRRKNRTDIKARLPALHIFGANQLPTSYDGVSRAFGRRMVIIRTSSFQAPADYVLDYEGLIWTEEKQGVVARAIRGLLDLMNQGGHYTRPESSHEAMDEFQTESDPVQQFLDEIKEGSVRDKNNVLVLVQNPTTSDPRKYIEQPHLWEIYSAWQADAEPDVRRRIGKKTFFKNLYSKKFYVAQHTKTRHVMGIGSVALNESVC